MITQNLVKAHYSNVILELAKTHDITKLSVKELVEAAGTARQTFYNHFNDIDDLICYVAILPFFSGDRPVFSLENQRESVQFAYDHQEFFSQLARHSGRNSYRETFVRQLRKVLGDAYITGDLDLAERQYREAFICLYCEGAVGMFIEWMANDFKTPVDVIVSVLYDPRPGFIRKDLVPDLRVRVDEIEA